MSMVVAIIWHQRGIVTDVLLNRLHRLIDTVVELLQLLLNLPFYRRKTGLCFNTRRNVVNNIADLPLIFRPTTHTELSFYLLQRFNQGSRSV